MKLNKLDGIELLNRFKLPTVNILNLSEVLKGNINISSGVSVRLSPRDKKAGWNVYLPSLHNCTDIAEIKKFIEKHAEYDAFIHYTVKPEIIGSISKIESNNEIVIETFKSFEDRNNGIINNRIKIPIVSGKIWTSKSIILKSDKNDFMYFMKVITMLNGFPFQQYDMEYVIQNKEIIFTDLTIPDSREYNSYKAFRIDEDR